MCVNFERKKVKELVALPRLRVSYLLCSWAPMAAKSTPLTVRDGAEAQPCSHMSPLRGARAQRCDAHWCSSQREKGKWARDEESKVAREEERCSADGKKERHLQLRAHPQVCKVDVTKPAWEQPTPVHNRWHPGLVCERCVRHVVRA